MLSYSLREGRDTPHVILYLHGLGIAGWSWDPVIDAVPGFGALVPDLPGHGKSSQTPWQSLADTAAAVAEVVDELPADMPLHLTGHSLGAYVGLNLLMLRRDRFATAVLSGFHISPPNQRMLLKLAYVANGLVFQSPRLLKRFASVFGDDAAQQHFVEGARDIKSRTVRRAGIQVVDFELPTGIDALTLPIMAIAGDREPETIRSTPEQLSKRLPDVRPHVLPNRDHLWPVKEPETYAALLAEHVAAHI